MTVLNNAICAFFLGVLFLNVKSWAHVSIDPKSATAGGYAKLNFRVPHGCEGSATTRVTVQLPEGALSVKPQVHAGWKITIKKSPLTDPVLLHGKEIKETVSEISWQGGPLLDEHMDEFGVSLKLPNRPGEKLYFPVTQDCKKGQIRWAEVPGAGHDAHASYPAPFLNLEAAPTK